MENKETYRDWKVGETSDTTMEIAILKGIEEGKNIAGLFLMAAKALAIVTNNSAFYTQVEADLSAMHGYGLQDQSVVEMEIESAEIRLEKLKKAIEGAPEAEAKRMERAIASHEKLLKELKGEA